MKDSPMVGERKDESAPEARNLSRKAIRLGAMTQTMGD